jgi:hypothetical protein
LARHRRPPCDAADDSALTLRGHTTARRVSPRAEARSRFDVDNGVVLYNDRHRDYLLVKDDEGAMLDYLAILVAKE